MFDVELKHSYRIPEKGSRDRHSRTSSPLNDRKMNLEGQLYRALEELWQVAVTVSTLKYVAGLLSQETVNMISNSLGKNLYKNLYNKQS